VDFQTSLIAAMILALGVPASGQNTNDPRSTERAVFFSGDVVLEGGSIPPDPVLIRRVCRGSVQGETWTDSKGRFSFKVEGGGSDTNADASQAPSRDPDLARPIGNSSYYSNPITSALRGCEVQAVLAGFWSDHANIELKNTLDDTRIGTIILHPVSHDQALTISATSLAAPRNAKSSYDKALSLMREKHWDAAAKELNKAVTAYPKYAAAWFELGILSDMRSDASSAASAWKTSLSCDPRYVKPYEGLAALAERQQNWAELDKYARDWIQLTPEGFPIAYLYLAIASAHLNDVEQAELAARQGLRLDKDHNLPRLNYVLALILMQKHEFAESAKCLRSYLEQAPNAKDAPLVRQELARIEAAAAPPK
jgi:tetratricopeptide (TPR) repeat protein